MQGAVSPSLYAHINILGKNGLDDENDEVTVSLDGDIMQTHAITG